MYIYVRTFLWGTKLIRTRTEPLRNKREFMEDYIQKVLFSIQIIIKYKFTFFNEIFDSLEQVQFKLACK